MGNYQKADEFFLKDLKIKEKVMNLKILKLRINNIYNYNSL